MCACERKAGICFTSSYKFKREIVDKITGEKRNRRTKEHILILCHWDEKIPANNNNNKKANKKMQTPNVQILLLF